MNVFKSIRFVFTLPIWVLQLGTSSKSFLDNPILGSQKLNRWGLHKGRVKVAAALCNWRRRRLAPKVKPEWKAAFDCDGFVAIHDVLPEAQFEKIRTSILNYEGEAREMRQGDAITRRLSVGPQMFAEIPELKVLLARNDIRALFHYVASFRIEPLHYIQTIATHFGSNEEDPQETLHADAFHSSLKAWLFLNAVDEDEAPFRFVPGSHRMEGARLEWEYQRSLADPRTIDRLSARGSPRIQAESLSDLGLPQARAMAVPANTLLVADTIGFHARGKSVRSVERVEIWSYARRNPFIPWIGGDVLSISGIAERRVDWLWGARDRFEKWVGQPWRKVGKRKALD